LTVKQVASSSTRLH